MLITTIGGFFMKKTILFFLMFVAIAGGIVLSLYMMSKTQPKVEEGETQNYYMGDKVTDDCIDEYDELTADEAEEANSNEEEKLSPNAIIIFEKIYKDCEHAIKKYEKIDNSLVNCTRSDIEEKFDSWKIKDFSKDQVILSQEVEGHCGDHYILQDINWKIDIYKLDREGNETLINETDISTEYLTETDMINMDNGLIVYGKESLNKLLEDFE